MSESSSGQPVLTSDKAWLLGLVAGDGHLQVSKDGYKLYIVANPDSDDIQPSAGGTGVTP